MKIEKVTDWIKANCVEKVIPHNVLKCVASLLFRFIKIQNCGILLANKTLRILMFLDDVYGEYNGSYRQNTEQKEIACLHVYQCYRELPRKPRMLTPWNVTKY